MHKAFLALTTCAALAGCSSVGTVNGVPVNRGATLSSQSEPAGFCARQPAVCILGGALAVGLVAAVASDGGDGGGGNPGDGTGDFD